MNTITTVKVEELQHFRDLLTEEAKKVYDTRYQNVIIEVFEHTSTAVIRHYLMCQYFMVVIDPKDKKEAIEKMAGVFNMLAKQDLIRGTLANAMALPLAKELEQERLGLLVYVFPSLKLRKLALDQIGDDDVYSKQRKVLNETVGVEAFVQEGGLGTADWKQLLT